MDLVLECLTKPTKKNAEATNPAEDEVDSKTGQDKETNKEVKEEDDGEERLAVVRHASVNGENELSLLLQNKESQETVRCLASQLYNVLNMVAKAYLAFVDFTGMRLDVALRLFLKAFMLEGSNEKQAHILAHFYERYHHCNPTAVASVDVVHCLTCVMMVLNTELHGENVILKMSCKDFLRILRRVDGGHVFPEKLSKRMYHSPF
uniref:SEC7 domain-containing protein n=1 Tax=Electrophorus electricus TaxID=8005 RepID=A0A4W4DMW4_ELEEL